MFSVCLMFLHFSKSSSGIVGWCCTWRKALSSPSSIVSMMFANSVIYLQI